MDTKEGLVNPSTYEIGLPFISVHTIIDCGFVLLVKSYCKVEAKQQKNLLYQSLEMLPRVLIVPPLLN